MDGKVIVTPGGRNGRSVVAYNKETGERVWGVLDDTASYTSSMLVELLGERQIVVVTASRMAALRVETGELLWEYPWRTMYDINSAPAIEGKTWNNPALDGGILLVRNAREMAAFDLRAE